MANINLLRTDAEKLEHGAWVPYHLGIRLKIRAHMNPEHIVALRAIAQRRRSELNGREWTDRDEDEVKREAAAVALLVDWENVEDDQGESIPYSLDQALAWYAEGDFNPLWDFVVLQSLIERNFRKAQLEADAKN